MTNNVNISYSVELKWIWVAKVNLSWYRCKLGVIVKLQMKTSRALTLDVFLDYPGMDGYCSCFQSSLLLKVRRVGREGNFVGQRQVGLEIYIENDVVHPPLTQ